MEFTLMKNINLANNVTCYVVEFDTKVFDINSDCKLETSTFTAPVTGRYQIGAWRIIS
jgi:hypothetical protein